MNNLINFFKYFNTHYVPHTRTWATCYRMGTVVNTNMFTESFHCFLKVVYLNNKQNRCVDWLIHVLRIAWNLVYKLWVHVSCTNNSNIEDDNIFISQNCRKHYNIHKCTLIPQCVSLQIYTILM